MRRADRHWRMARNGAGLVAAAALLGACSVAGLPAFKAAPAGVAAAQPPTTTPAPLLAGAPPDGAPLAFAAPAPAVPRAAGVDALIAEYAARYGVPETLVRRLVARESGFNPRARNGPNLGLMQIQHGTARSMGYAGSPEGLLDADTNLRYGVKYLRGAWLVAGRDPERALRAYQRGYYYDAKRLGLLDEVGL